MEAGVHAVEHKVDPAKIQYWTTKRVRSPLSFWKDKLGTLPTAVKEGTHQITAPLEDLVEKAGHMLEPPKASYWQPERVKDPELFRKTVGMLASELKTAQNLSPKILHSLASSLSEDLDSVPPLNIPQARYWAPRRVQDPLGRPLAALPSFGGPELPLPMPNGELSRMHGLPRRATSEHSPSEYSGGISSDYCSSSGHSLKRRRESRQCLSSGHRRPQHGGKHPQLSEHLWNGRQPHLWNHGRYGYESEHDDEGPRGLRRVSTQLNHAVHDLNELMEEALVVAEDAAQRGKPEEIATIFSNAANMLRQTAPLRDHQSRHSSSDSEASEFSGFHYRANSVDVAPCTKSAKTSQQPLLVEQYRNAGEAPVSQRAFVENRRSSSRSITMTPPHLYSQPSASSMIRDFQYNEPMRRLARPRKDDPVQLHHLGLPPSLRQDLPGAAMTRELQPGYTPPLRPVRPEPIVEKVSSMDKKRRKFITAIDPLANTVEEPNSEVPMEEETPSPNKASGKPHTWGPSSNYDLVGKHHVSLRADQGFSLGRHHQRQPIAREWQPARKRITATIACLNTVFIGLIAGIYVSGCTMIRSESLLT